MLPRLLPFCFLWAVTLTSSNSCISSSDGTRGCFFTYCEKDSVVLSACCELTAYSIRGDTLGTSRESRCIETVDVPPSFVWASRVNGVPSTKSSPEMTNRLLSPSWNWVISSVVGEKSTTFSPFGRRLNDFSTWPLMDCDCSAGKSIFGRESFRMSEQSYLRHPCVIISRSRSLSVPASGFSK